MRLRPRHFTTSIMTPHRVLPRFIFLVVVLLSPCFAWMTPPQQQQASSSSSSSVSISKSVLKASEDTADEVAHTHRIMWKQHSRQRQSMQYRIIASEACEDMAKAMEAVRQNQKRPWGYTTYTHPPPYAENMCSMWIYNIYTCSH